MTANIIQGTTGDDILLNTSAGDDFWGDDGRDTVSYAGDPLGISANLNFRPGIFGLVTDGYGNLDRLYNTESLRGSAHNDILRGDAGDNVLEGLGGANTLEGRGGIDTVSYATHANPVDVNLGFRPGSFGIGNHDGRIDRLVGIENVIGSNGNDVIYGDAGANRLEGGAGNDTIYGGAQTPGTGDIIIGGAGNDTMKGGGVQDVFVFGANSGKDKIYDYFLSFRPTDPWDKIDVSALGIHNIGELDIKQIYASSSLIHFSEGNEVIVMGVAPQQWTNAQFVFA